MSTPLPFVGKSSCNTNFDAQHQALYEEQMFRGRDIQPNSYMPRHPDNPNDATDSGIAGFVNLSSRLRPCYNRVLAGSHLSLRNYQRPTALVLDPLPYEVQLPHDIRRDMEFTRVEESKCARPQGCALRDFGGLHGKNLVQIRQV